LFLLLLALFLFPLAVYCTVLGMINRRVRPLAVSGPWDFLGLLLGLSGFLLFLGPALWSGLFRQNLNDLPFQRGITSMASAVEVAWLSWWLGWVVYYLVVLGGAALLLWLRRQTTVIYNIDPQTMDSVLARVAERLGLRANRLGNRLFLGVSPIPVPVAAPVDLASHVTVLPAAAELSTHISAAPVSAGTAGELADDSQDRPTRLAGEQVVLDVDAFELLSNVSLHWRSASPTARAQVERELRLVLAETAAPDNAISAWLLGIATLLFLVVIMITTVSVVAGILEKSQR
jgi:hypothetical protein